MSLKYGISITDEKVGVTSPIMLHASSFEPCFQAAAECGYDGVELQIKNPASRDVKELRRLMDQYHLEIPCITSGMEYFGNGLSMISDDEDIQRRAVDRLIEHINLASELGSMVLFGSMRGNIDDFSRYSELEARLIGNIRKVQKAAEEKKVDVVFEPINLYVINYINSTDEAAEFVKKVNSPRFWLMIDTHHMQIHDGDMYETILRNKDLIRYAHFSDGNRYYPGGGNVNFYQCTKALLEMGYNGWVTMECLTLADGKDSAKRAITHCRHLEEACKAILT